MLGKQGSGCGGVDVLTIVSTDSEQRSQTHHNDELT